MYYFMSSADHTHFLDDKHGGHYVSNSFSSHSDCRCVLYDKVPLGSEEIQKILRPCQEVPPGSFSSFLGSLVSGKLQKLYSYAHTMSPLLTLTPSFLLLYLSVNKCIHFQELAHTHTY